MRRRSALAALGTVGLAGCLRLTGDQQGGQTGENDTDGDPGETDTADEGDEAFETATVYAFDRPSGALRWVHETAANGQETDVEAVAHADGRVFYGADSSGSGSDQRPVFRGLDAESGDELWERRLDGSFVAGLLAHGEEVYAWRNNRATLFDAETGETVSEFDHAPGFNGFTRRGETAYVVDRSDASFALDVASGERLWERPFDREANGRPAVDGDLLCYGTEAGYVVAVDATDGTRRWESRVDGVVRRQPAPTDDLVWVVDERPAVYALRRADGEIVHRIESGLDDSRTRVSAVGTHVCVRGEAGPLVYEVTVADDGSVTDRSEAWEYPAEKFLPYTHEDHFVGGIRRLHHCTADGDVVWESERVGNWLDVNEGLAVRTTDDAVYIAGG